MRKKPRSLRATDGIFILAACAVLFFTVQGRHGLLYLNQIDNELAGLRKELRQTESEIVTVSNEMYAFENNDLLLEKKARETLGLSRPGDIVYILISESSETAEAE